MGRKIKQNKVVGENVRVKRKLMDKSKRRLEVELNNYDTVEKEGIKQRTVLQDSDIENKKTTNLVPVSEVFLAVQLDF
ncbi:hypothetical protein DGG96_03555 [Legionella qingyii]|uniref:Uncharacterized protein n=1 Tax=Legionella qingyii TaxID=2184757 RepID=A0A317U507_9GAMM|nr:hypothetical protein [Legionella qingyii]PWY57074.1 hypothetical protein DGG96_03555 [Legionella qingyii]